MNWYLETLETVRDIRWALCREKGLALFTALHLYYEAVCLVLCLVLWRSLLEVQSYCC